MYVIPRFTYLLRDKAVHPPYLVLEPPPYLKRIIFQTVYLRRNRDEKKDFFGLGTAYIGSPASTAAGL